MNSPFHLNHIAMAKIQNDKYLSCVLLIYLLHEYVKPMVIGEFPPSSTELIHLIIDVLVNKQLLSSRRSLMHIFNYSIK